MPTMTEAPASSLQTRKRPYKLIAGAVVAVGLVAALAGAWWLGLLTPEPEAVSLASTIEAVQAEAQAEIDPAAAVTETEPVTDTASDADVDETVAADTDTAETEPAVSADGIDGTWSVVASDATFAGYRADSNVGEAVGRTPGVTGTVVALDNQITSVSITVDMTQLTSDSSLRDEHLGDEGVEYNTYPTSHFELTDVIVIDTIPDEGVAALFQAVGVLTVRDIPLPATINLEATLVGDQLVVAGSSAINLDDYGASVSTDEAVMEFSLLLAR